MSDPLSAAVQAAVERAIDARLPIIIEALKSATTPASAEPDRFYRLTAAADRLGLSPSSIWRLEREGKLPPREKLGGSTGYRESTLKKILDGLSTEPVPPPTGAIKKGERRGGRRA